MRRKFKPNPYRRRSKPRYPRLTFDASWRASIAGLTQSYMRLFGRGPFQLRRAQPGAPAPYVVELTLPDGRGYTGYLRKHTTDGKDWYEGFLDADRLAVALCDEELNADGAVPVDAHPKFGLWPRQLKINSSPLPQRGEKGAEFLGTLWVSALDGWPGGELYTVAANSSWTAVMKGYVTRHKPRR